MSTPRRTWAFHPERDRLLLEAHARPSTPVTAPAMATRIATITGVMGAGADLAHVTALCRKVGFSEPGANARWHMVEGGRWRLRWERHTEVSTWTVFREGVGLEAAQFVETALDLLPQDWLKELPGDVLAAVHAAVIHDASPVLPFNDADLVSTSVADAAIEVHTDFHQGPDGFTRFILVQDGGGAATAGRVLQQMFEIETYRLLALMAFPVATRTSTELAKLEEDASEAAQKVIGEGGVEADRALVSRLAALAGAAEAQAGATSFRFSAARAYFGLVQERIGQLRERSLGARLTIGAFMERRLAPAMRTCAAVEARQRDVIERIARTTQMLNTRVEVASEAINVGLLASMDRRAQEQLRLQQAVEGLSIAAISYYALGLLEIVIEGLAQLNRAINPKLVTAFSVPFVVAAVWFLLRQVRARIEKNEAAAADTPPTDDPSPPKP